MRYFWDLEAVCYTFSNVEFYIEKDTVYLLHLQITARSQVNMIGSVYLLHKGGGASIVAVLR